MTTYTLSEKQLSDIVKASIEKCMADIEGKIRKFTKESIKEVLEGGETTSSSAGKPKSSSKGASKASKASKGAPKEGLKERIQRVVNSKKVKSQAYYDVDLKRAYVIQAPKKVTHFFYALGEGEDKVYVMGKKESTELVKVLKELGYEGAEPISFEKTSKKKALPKKTTAKKPPLPKKTIPKPSVAKKSYVPKKTTPKPSVAKKSYVPKKIEPLKVEFDEELKVFKDSEGYLYVPSVEGEKLAEPMAIGKLNSQNKPLKLTKEDIQGLEKRSIKLWHIENIEPVPNEVVIKDILEEQQRIVASSISEDLEEDIEEKEESDYSGEADGDVIDETLKAINETLEPDITITEEDVRTYFKFLQKNEVINNLVEDAKKMGISEDKLRAIIDQEEELKEEYKTLIEKIKKPKKIVKKKGRILDVN